MKMDAALPVKLVLSVIYSPYLRCTYIATALVWSYYPPGPTNSILMATSTSGPPRQAGMEVLEAQGYMNMDGRHEPYKACPPLR